MGEQPQTGPDGTLVNQNERPQDSYNGATFGPEPERLHREESIRLAERKEEDSTRVLVIIRSYRRRLLDWDNLFQKYFVDACRYSGLIREDNPQEVLQSITQIKVERKEDERTEIELVYPSTASLVNHNPPPLF